MRDSCAGIRSTRRNLVFRYALKDWIPLALGIALNQGSQMKKTPDTSREICEAYLKEEIHSNELQRVWPSEVQMARRMLARGDALAGFYSEIYPALDRDGIAWKHAIGCALRVGAHWSPEKIAKSRVGRKELEELGQAISKQAVALADLLDRRTELYNHSGFSADTLYAIRDVIDEAAAGNGLYQLRLKKSLQALGDRFDGKYWPTMAQCVRAIGQDAYMAEIKATDPLTGVATNSLRPSKADFLRALFESIEECRGESLGDIPGGFDLSNSSLASLVNVLLGLPADKLVGDDYVKTQRHRFRSAVVESR
jgi:hypothetical protein